MKQLSLLLGLLVLLTAPASAQAPSLKVLHEAERAAASTSGSLKDWLRLRESELNAGSRVIQTAAGPIEFRKEGTGPAVICLHGAYGGYDESSLIGRFLVAKGFTVIGVSRPGYLRTPLSVGSTPVQQAEAMIALMDSLHLKKAAVYGFSAGTLTAFQMAVRHPDRIWACVLTGVGALPDDFQPGGTYDQMRAVVGDKAAIPYLDGVSWFIDTINTADLNLTASIMLRADVLDDTPEAVVYRRIVYVQHHPEQREFLSAFTRTLTPYSPRQPGIYNDIKTNLAIDPWQSWIDKGLLKKVTVPIQVVQSLDDGSGNYAEAQNLIVPNIPHARLVTVPGAGHFVWLGSATPSWEAQTVSFLKTYVP